MGNKDKFLQVIRDQFKETDPAIISWDTDFVHLNEWSSLTALFVAAAIEEEFGVNITALEMKSSKTTAELLKIVESKIAEGPKTATATIKLEVEKEIEVTMPQMAMNALSESWLYKELGDLHWELLSKGLGQKSSRFQDEEGNRLYATFVRITLKIDQLTNFKENDVIAFKGSVKKYGNSAYISDLSGANGPHRLSANMVTIFSVRNANDNSKIEKSKPVTLQNSIEELTSAPVMLDEYYSLKRNVINSWQLGEYSFSITDDAIWSEEYAINPFIDINGVGLLYFAAYPIIADYKMRSFFAWKFNDLNFENSFSTIYRDINYFSNCNVTDTIIMKVNTFEQDGKIIKIQSSLYRKSDGALLAKLFTIKSM